jgi:hypothetical protein
MAAKRSGLGPSRRAANALAGALAAEGSNERSSRRDDGTAPGDGGLHGSWMRVLPSAGAGRDARRSRSTFLDGLACAGSAGAGTTRTGAGPAGCSAAGPGVGAGTGSGSGGGSEAGRAG